LGSKGKNIKAALLFLFLYLLSRHYLCYFRHYFIYVQKHSIIIYYLSNEFYDNYVGKAIWWSFFIAFAAKLAIPPLHLWLVEAHV
jgi:NADH:ubiquinone oxidoreductase subunit 4 (subunit M)